MSEPRSHLLGNSGDKRTLCGIPTNSNEHMPYVLARFAQAHIDGRDMRVCADCAARYPHLTLRPTWDQPSLFA